MYKLRTLYICLSDHGYNHTPLILSLDPATYGDYHSHSYSTYPFESSCTTCGYTSYLCACGVSFEADYMPLLEHSFHEGVVIQEPTISEPGIQEFTCSACGEVFTEEIAPLTSLGTEPESSGYREPYEDDEEESPLRKVIIIAGVILFIVAGINGKKKKKKS